MAHNVKPSMEVGVLAQQSLCRPHQGPRKAPARKEYCGPTVSKSYNTVTSIIQPRSSFVGTEWTFNASSCEKARPEGLRQVPWGHSNLTQFREADRQILQKSRYLLTIGALWGHSVIYYVIFTAVMSYVSTRPGIWNFWSQTCIGYAASSCRPVFLWPDSL